MQPPPIHQIRDRLLQGLDKEYNVVDMAIVVEVISQLENFAITKEALEATRLGKHINELRRKASDKQLASRAKSLVKKWRELLMPSGTATPVQTNAPKDPRAVVASAQQRLNGHHHHQLTAAAAAASSQPSSRLTSPATSSRLSPGLMRPTHNHAASSSLPSSASSSPGLSRPTTPNHQGHSRPVSPAVPRTHAANKRLRKDEEDAEEPPSKKANCDTMVGSVATNGKKAAATITRRKKLEQERERLLEQKLLTARRQSSKVRTTQELVQELALRTTPKPPASSSNNGGSNGPIISETKTELMNRFFESQSNGGHSVLSPPLSSEGAPSPEEDEAKEELELVQQPSEGASKETVEDVLAQLPPIDVAAIMAEINSEMQSSANEDDEEEEHIEGLIPAKKVEAEPVSEGVMAAMVQELHSGQHESVNGNFTHDGAFKEWHEVVSKETLHGDLIYILPYSVID